jgi:2-dehydropantoate 2-reductase
VTRYIFIGAGAIGGGMGARLFQSERDVLLIARGTHLEAMQRDGLRLRTPYEDVRLSIPVAGGPAGLTLRPDDLLVLATKTHQAQEALVTWADVPVEGGGTAGERLALFTALNGVVSEPMALRYFRRVYGVCVWMWAAHLNPGEVIVEGVPTSGMFHVGRFPAAVADADDAALLEEVRVDWNRALLQTELPADVMTWKYRKLLSNVANAVQALVGNAQGSGSIIRAATAEGRAVLDQADIAYTSDEEEAAARARAFRVEPVPGLPAFVGGSTWQSLSRATGNVESDYLNGELVTIARQHGGDAPMNATLASLVRQAAARGAPPPSMTVPELSARLGLS